MKLILIYSCALLFGIGIIGIAFPGLPTTPFLLLSAGFYIRSSDRLYQKLILNKWVGFYITGYQKNKGLTKRTKIEANLAMWFMIALSCLLFISSLKIKGLVIFVGLAGPMVMGWLIPTVPFSGDQKDH